MTDLILSLGSNVNKVHNLTAGLKRLQELFGELFCSSWYESDAAGFTGDSFYNLVVVAKVNIPLDQIILLLKNVEIEFGRDMDAPKFSQKTLDIDILCFGGLVGEFFNVELPRPEIIESIYVLQPLCEMLPNSVHPKLGKTYHQVLEEFEAPLYNIRKLD